MSFLAPDYGIFSNKLLTANEFNFRIVATDQYSKHSSNPISNDFKVTFSNPCTAGSLQTKTGETAPTDVDYVVEADGSTSL